MISEKEKEQKIVEMFIDSTKTFIQLSTGALVLSITFVREILGLKDAIPADFFLIASWLSFLIAIGAGATYQYLAIKFLEMEADLPSYPIYFPKSLVKRPGLLYGTMMVAFYLGAIAFTIVAIKRLH